MGGVEEEVYESLALLVLLAILSFTLVASLRWYPHYPLVAVRFDTKAQLRATELLREVLSAAEYEHLERFGCLTVPSPGVPERTYRIPSSPGMVAVYQSGILVEKLCLRPVEHLPAADVVLMLKLMIEAKEEAYLRTANVQVTEDPVVWPEWRR